MAARVRLTVGLACALALSAGTAQAHVTRARADAVALRTLHGLPRSPSVLFRLPHSLRRGTRIAIARSGRRGALRLRTRAYLYWADFAPEDYFDHIGSLVVVSARTGRVLRHEPTITWPLVNGRTAAFLRSAHAYNSHRYRVLTRGGGGARARAAPRPQPVAVAAAGNDAQCMIVAGPPRSVLDVSKPLTMFTWGGHLNDADQMVALANRLGVPVRRAYDLNDLRDQLSSAPAQGCTDVLVFITGEGSPEPIPIPGPLRDLLGGPRYFPIYGNADPNVELGPDGPKITDQQLAGALRDAHNGAPAANYTVMIQECFGGRMLGALDRIPGVDAVATSSSPTTEASRYPKGIPSGASPWVNQMTDGLLKAFGDAAGKVLSWDEAVGQAFDGLEASSDTPQLDVQGVIRSKGPESGPSGGDTCSASPQPCFIEIQVNGYGPGNGDRKAGLGIVTVSPDPPGCDCAMEFRTGTWAAQFNGQFGCYNGYTDVNVCHGFSWYKAQTITLKAFPVPKGGYGNNSPGQDSVFAGWGGDCSGSSTVCEVQLGKQRPVTGSGGQSGYSLSVTAFFAAP